MTKAQRERVRRHAAVVAIAPPVAPIDTEADRLQAFRRWRGDEGEGHNQADADPRPIRVTLRLRTGA